MSAKKGGKTSTEEAAAAIYEYLRVQNRPYSAKNVFDNLHGIVGATAVAKILDDLADKGKIVRKDNKKQKIYWIVQPKLEELSDGMTSAKGLEEEAKALKERVDEARSAADRLSGENRALEGQPGNEEAAELIAKLKEETRALEERLEGLRGTSVKISKEEVDGAERQYAAMKNLWKKRRRLCKDILGGMMESSGKSFRELAEEIGLETDEDCGIKDIDDDESSRFRKKPK